MLREMKRASKEGDWLLPTGISKRPRTRGDCVAGPRPCPFVGCRYHLYLDIGEHNGSIKVNRPGVAVWDTAASCALDEAERGGMTHLEIAELLGVTQQRVDQIEKAAMLRLAERIGNDPELPQSDLPFAQERSIKPNEVLAALGLEGDSWLRNLVNSHLSMNRENVPWRTSTTALG